MLHVIDIGPNAHNILVDIVSNLQCSLITRVLYCIQHLFMVQYTDSMVELAAVFTDISFP